MHTVAVFLWEPPGIIKETYKFLYPKKKKQKILIEINKQYLNTFILKDAKPAQLEQ